MWAHLWYNLSRERIKTLIMIKTALLCKFFNHIGGLSSICQNAAFKQTIFWNYMQIAEKIP